IGRPPVGGLPRSDSDLSAIKIYSNDPYVRSAAGDVGINNFLMGSGVLQSGSVHINVNDIAAGSPGYVLISTTPRVFYVAADVNQSAAANDVFALNILAKDNFTIGALTPGDGIHTVDPVTFPVQTGAHVIGATIDTMTVTFTDLLPNSVQQNQD